MAHKISDWIALALLFPNSMATISEKGISTDPIDRSAINVAVRAAKPVKKAKMKRFDGFTRASSYFEAQISWAVRFS